MSLEQLREDGVIDEVLGRLKSGKEADVWLVRHGEQIWAAKVYKDRATRSFKNSSGYKEGRAVRNSRTQRAMDRGSKFGQAAAEEAWKSAESDALHKLHAQGVRVPTPVLFYEGILLMELVLDEGGHPAPRLIDALIPPDVAGALYADLRAQAIGMLCCDLIHGDLSAYNVLLGVAGPTIIDFPQVVGASHNSQAQEYFTRDIENLRTFFAAADPALESRKGDAAEIWQAYVRRDLSPDFVPSGRPPPPPRQAHQGHGGGQRPARPQGGHHDQRGPARPQGSPAPPHANAAPRPPGGNRDQRRPARPQGAPRQTHGAPQHAAPRPQGAPPQPHAAPRPHANQPQTHASPKPHGNQPQTHASPKPHGNQPQTHASPKPHGNQPQTHVSPRPHGNQPQTQVSPRPHGNPPQTHASPRPHGNQPPHPRRGDKPNQRPPQRPSPVVERVVRPAHPPGRRHGRPAPHDPTRKG